MCRLLFLWLTVWGLTAVAAERPNIVIIYADDLGYGDLGCYGHPTLQTPNLDRMAREGIRFTEFYSAAEVCTPSRAALLTGRYPVRSGMAHDRYRVLRSQSTGHLPADEVTLAEVLQANGYATGMVGKWHLGVWSNDPQGHPRRHGFDSFFGLPHSNDMDPVAGIPPRANTLAEQQAEWWNSPLYRNEELVERPADQTTLTRRYTEEAQRFIRENRRRPFFLYFAHTFPHTPLFASGAFRGTSRRGLYGDVVAELDWSVGQILETLHREKLDRKTVVVFSSDNGPWLIMNQQGVPLVSCATAKAAPGKVACGCRRSRGGRDESSRVRLRKALRVRWTCSPRAFVWRAFRFPLTELSMGLFSPISCSRARPARGKRCSTIGAPGSMRPAVVDGNFIF